MAGGWRKACLWKALLALGFTPIGDDQRTANRTIFGVDMFDKPNVEAFQTVVHYLFLQLDQTRANFVFRDCWPIYDKKGAACFRKWMKKIAVCKSGLTMIYLKHICFISSRDCWPIYDKKGAACFRKWMKKIADEVGNSFPQVVASLFLSPGGPKFINLVYAFARYVLTHKLNKQLEESNWCHRTVRRRSQDLHLSAMECCIARNQLLEGIQKEAFLIDEYKRREALLVNENQALKKQPNEKAASGFTEHVAELKEPREMWTTIMGTLLELEKENEIIVSVMDGHVDLNILDATDISLRVPRPLVTKVQNEADQIEDLYKAGKLNPAAIYQLCNWSLRLLGDQCNQVRLVELEHLLSLEKLATFLKNELMEMEERSQKITQEVFPSVKQSIAKLESAWDKKWEQYLSRTGFSPMRKKYPVLDLLPSMPTLSFEPASEEAYRSSIFYSHSATFSGPDELCTTGSEREDSDNLSMAHGYHAPSTSELQCSECFTPSIRTPNVQTTSCLKEEPIEIPSVTRQPLESGLLSPRVGKMEKNKDRSPPLSNKLESCSKRNEPHQKTVDQLAEEVADALTKDSPGVFQQDLMQEEYFFSLTNNPFIAQTELPRTPENLITDIRNTWRCAVQESELEQIKRQESVSTCPQQTNCTTDQSLLKPEESSPAADMKVPGSFLENAPTDAAAIHCVEFDKMENWSKPPSSPDAESTDSNHLSIRNEAQAMTKFQLDHCREPEIDCSNVGCADESLHLNNKGASDDTDILISKVLAPSSSQVFSSSEDCVKKSSGSLNNSVTDDEIYFGHSRQFSLVERLNRKSPIKKEKLSKSFIMEMCKSSDAVENVEPYASFDTELDSTLLWNEAQNVTNTPNDRLKSPPRFGILQETVPDVLGIDSLNSSKSSSADQLEESQLTIPCLQNRLKQLNTKCLAFTKYGGSETLNLAENMGASYFRTSTDSKEQCQSELLKVDYMNEEVDNVDKLFTLESKSLKGLLPVSLETQKPASYPISLNALEVQGDASQMTCLAKSEIPSVNLDNGVGELITF
ncbi:HAUS augmin-like complex subunit 6 [Narcine bancroftii]|uniref:HAUS augmin-like complex subunit 6 n=1 Tax=Narcine bancroftii TaxID=1343680 RepID=UPI003831BE16